MGLKLYSDEVTLFFAKDRTDFLNKLVDYYGCVPEDPDCWQEMEPDERLWTVYQDGHLPVPSGAFVEDDLDSQWRLEHLDPVAVTATLREWAIFRGAGFFCCTEI